jgi:broad specificity phosphatase PhoE
MATRPATKSKRIGKTADDIFVPRIANDDADRPKKRGRRPSHTEHWTKVTVVLDRLGADIRAASGVAISRAHVIRALIDALSESDLDLTGTRSENDLKAILTARLGRYRA